MGQLEIDLVTLFPTMIEGFLGESMLGRAIKKRLINVRAHDLRQWAHGKHSITDDRPFGGGAGMVLKPEPLVEAIEDLKKSEWTGSLVIYLCPDGQLLNPSMAKRLSLEKHLILISGHYEGIDQRVRDHWVDEEISIGDYVLTNGTLPAAVLVDAICRYIPGVLGEEKSLTQDSFNDSLLSFPQYTRPAEFRGYAIPDKLLSGHHVEIEQWRLAQQKEKTQMRRPELYKQYLKSNEHNN